VGCQQRLGQLVQIAGGVAAPNTSIAAIDRTPTHLDLFAVGTDQRIYSIWWDASGGWAGSWFNVSGGVAARARRSAWWRATHSSRRLRRRVDHGIYSTWWDASSGWANWFQIAGGVAAPNTSVNALARYPDHLDVFAVGTDLHVDTTWWEDEMYFSMQPQQQSNWCWAATATSVALFISPPAPGRNVWSPTTRPGAATAAAAGARAMQCRRVSQQRAQRRGTSRPDGGRRGHRPQIETEVTYARPLGIRVAWSGGGAHFLCIMGQYSAGGTDYVTVDDPIYGRSNVSYAALQTAYQSIGTWTHTYYTRY